MGVHENGNGTAEGGYIKIPHFLSAGAYEDLMLEAKMAYGLLLYQGTERMTDGDSG